MPSTVSQSWMDKLRRSFRSSFRRREELDNDGGGGSGQGAGRQWPADEAAVKSNNCSFEVKYLGCLEVRGTPGAGSLGSGHPRQYCRCSSPGECRFVKKL